MPFSEECIITVSMTGVLIWRPDLSRRKIMKKRHKWVPPKNCRGGPRLCTDGFILSWVIQRHGAISQRLEERYKPVKPKGSKTLYSVSRITDHCPSRITAQHSQQQLPVQAHPAMAPFSQVHYDQDLIAFSNTIYSCLSTV